MNQFADVMEIKSAPVAPVDAESSHFLSFQVPQIKNADDFYLFCQENPDYKFEREAHGRIIVMPNTGGVTGRLNSKLNLRVGVWNEETNLGDVFDSSTAFSQPNGGTRSPDVAWISRTRWEALTTEQEQKKFPPIWPDFVIELLSETDLLKVAKAKMEDVWMANGCRMALAHRSQNANHPHLPGERRNPNRRFRQGVVWRRCAARIHACFSVKNNV